MRRTAAKSTRIRRATVAGLALGLALLAAPPARAAAPDPAKAVAAWKRVDKPDRLIIVRRTAIELVDATGLVARLSRPRGPVSLDWMATRIQDVPWLAGKDKWVARPVKGTIALSAALLLGGGTTLTVGGATERLLLAGGDAPSRAAWIRAGRARLAITKVTLFSWNPASGRAVAPGSAGRPYIRVGAGGRLEITGSELGYLGVPGRDSGLTWGRDSGGRIADSTVKGNQVGLALVGSRGVEVENVTVTGSAGLGVVLRGDRGTQVEGLTANRGGQDGVRITGGSKRTMTALTARRNRGFGVSSTGAVQLTLIGSRTSANMKGGVHLAGCLGCRVDRPIALNEPVAVDISGAGGGGIDVLDPHFVGGGTGIRVVTPAHDVDISGGVITGARTALSVSGGAVTARSGVWRPVQTGAALYGKASGVELTGVTIHGGVDGVVATRTVTGTRLTDLAVTGVSNRAVSSASPGLTMVGGHVDRAATGVALRADASVSGLRVDGVTQGVRAAPGILVSARGLDVLATKTGIAAETGARVELAGSRVRAPIALRGDITQGDGNTITLPPFPWLGVVAIGVLLAALLLYGVHRVRQGQIQPLRAPAYILNR
jgi:hypothetical protein